MDTERLLLIVEDDEAFARTLTRSFERRGYRVLHADGMAGMEALLVEHTPHYAVVDLKLKGEATGLACMRTARPCASSCSPALPALPLR